MKARLFDRRTRQLAHRAWTDAERTIVWRGLTGRMAIAIEPLIGLLFMTFLTWGIVYRSQHVAAERDLIKIAWIFGIGAVAFAGYFVAVLIAPFIAYLQTFKPIYVVDGYVRYRQPRREVQRGCFRLYRYALRRPERGVRMGIFR